jgi:WS/DGAT/MGAT family acyltransferase
MAHEETDMLEMAGADAYFLREESRERHMHTLKVVVVDPAGAHERPTLERVREGVTHVLPHEPAFRRRALDVPAPFGNPFWIDAPALDPDYHVRHVVLPEGAADGALDELAGRIASEPLDRERPLWQIFFVEGLPGGRVAYVTKVHHAVADGGASAALVLKIFQSTRSPANYRVPALPAAEILPRPSTRIRAAARIHLRRQLELPGLLLRSLRELGISIAWRASGRSMGAYPFRSPATRFNQPITPNRVCSHVTLSLPAMREVKQAIGCTLNDIYLALVGGALRRYLIGRGELDDRPLTAAIPVSVRRQQDEPAFGNALAYWFASTASDIADPVERLRAVAASTCAARALFERRDPRLALEWFDHWVLRRLYLTALPSFVSALLGRPSFNVIVSNVRGPSQPLYSNGAPVTELFSVGPLSLQQGLNFTAWSYMDAFAVGIHACREHVPDVSLLAEGIAGELDVLRKECGIA